MQCLMARRAGRGVAEGWEGCPTEKARVASNNLPAACLFLAGFILARTPSRRIWGLGVVVGEGAQASVFPRTFRKPPVRRGNGAELGAWVSAGGCVWGLGSPGQPHPRCWPTGSELESGSNRLFKLPRVCVGGRGARRAGSDFSRFAPSPPRHSAHALAPGLKARWGSKWRGHFLHVWGGGGES